MPCLNSKGGASKSSPATRRVKIWPQNINNNNYIIIDNFIINLKNMIIDLILNRKDGENYNPKKFYNDVINYGEQGHEIAEMLDNGQNKDIKQALKNYILKNDYNTNIIKYINSQNWL